MDILNIILITGPIILGTYSIYLAVKKFWIKSIVLWIACFVMVASGVVIYYNRKDKSLNPIEINIQKSNGINVNKVNGNVEINTKK